MTGIKALLVSIGVVVITALATVAEEGAEKKTPPPVIRVVEVEKIAEALDKEVIIRGKVTRTGKSKTGINFLNFANYNFVVVCFPAAVPKFEKGEPAEVYKGQVVEVRGKIEKYRDKYQIKLNKPEQIKIVERSETEQAASAAAENADQEKDEDSKPKAKAPKKEGKPVDSKKFFDC